MRNFSVPAFAGALLLATASLAGAATMPAGVKDAGGMLVDAKGMSLYTYDNDKTPGKSSCMGPCLVAWPALIVAADTKASGDFSVITRDDGSKQLAYQGKPLYFYAKDAKPGDMDGDGKGKVWHMAMP